MIAAPVNQINHKYIDRSVSEWLDVHFGDHSFNGRVFIGHRKHGGGVYTMTARNLSELKEYVMLMHASNRLDYYITANTVSGVNRTMDGLFGLQNIVIDIDCHDANSNSAALVQSFLWRAERDLWTDEDFACPNTVVSTGRGVQLWWAINPCHATSLFFYNQIKTGLMDRLEDLLSEYPEELDGLNVDRSASSNAVGYYRLPFTYNTAAKVYGSLQILHNKRYSTHDLAGYIRPLPRPKTPVRAPEGHLGPIPMQSGDLIVLHNAHSTGSKRVVQLIKLRNIRNNDVGSETRNNLCFAVYNSLRMSFDHEEAMRRLRAYNTAFKQPMTDAELESTVCSAAHKNGYKYTNAKLIEFLEITPHEQDAIGLHPFTGVYKPYNHAKPNATRDSVRKSRKEGRDSQIIAMHQEGISQAETARRLDISRNTVAKVIKDWLAQVEESVENSAEDDLLKNGAIYDCLLVSPGGGLSTGDGQPLSPASTDIDAIPVCSTVGLPGRRSD
jgi:predicted DNA-binding protein (UPF0251 family)